MRKLVLVRCVDSILLPVTFTRFNLLSHATASTYVLRLVSLGDVLPGYKLYA